jgi:hypothetical protein
MTALLIITLAHGDQVEPLPAPNVPSDCLGLVPFLCAGGLALIFTALLVLLVEDHSNDSKLLGEQQSQLTIFQRRFVGLSEKEREWSIRSQSSYYGYSPVRGASRAPQLRPPLPPRPAATSAPCLQKVIWCVSTALVPYSSSYPCVLRPSILLILDLLAQPPSPTSPSPTQVSSAAPMLSMAKLIMHRHVRIACFVSHLSPWLT